MIKNQNLNKYVLENFSKIDGWVNLEIFNFLDFLSNFVSRGEGMVEIGVHHGKFFFGLRSLLPGPEISIAVDVFEDQQIYNIDASGSGDLKIFSKNVKNYDPFFGENVKVIVGDSTLGATIEAIKLLAPKSVRYISIDGGHTRQHVINDLYIAESLISEDGIIIVDDFLHPHWLGVTDGTIEFIGRGTSIVPFAFGYNKLYMCKISSHHKFYEAIRNSQFNHEEESLHGCKLWTIYKNKE